MIFLKKIRSLQNTSEAREKERLICVRTKIIESGYPIFPVSMHKFPQLCLRVHVKTEGVLFNC